MKKIKEYSVKLTATVLGAGYAPVAPGTAGTVVAYILFAAYYTIFPYSYSLGFLALIILLFFVGVKSSELAEHYFGHDGSQIVIDEFVGYLIAVMYLPLFGKSPWIWGFFALLLFRAFDIFKPGPIDKVQKLKHGWGIMMDDVLAGLASNLLIQFYLRAVGRGSIG